MLLIIASPSFAAVYLDASGSGCSNGVTNYDPVSRSCGSGSDTVYTSLATFNDGIVAGATNYIRAGTYYRTSGTAAGALDVAPGKDGTSGARTIIKAYHGEERTCYIGTAANRMPVSVGGTAATDYNPTPSDRGTSGTNYYPNPAVTVRSSYVTIDGIKTYGQVVFLDVIGGATTHDNTLQNSDLGGGGPSEDQGQVVKLHSGYNFLVTNNYIHDSCVGDAGWNGALIMGYNFHANITHNTFANAYEVAIFYKDTGGQSGRTGEIAYNFFGPSTLVAGGGNGFRAHNQDYQISNLIVHNNIFLDLEAGVNWAYAATGDNLIYNNTFVNCGGRSAPIDPGGDILQLSESGNAVAAYNNIYYHAANAITYDIDVGTNLEGSNYNLWYGAGSKTWTVGATNTSTFSTWQGVGFDAASSASINPNFINASGTTAASFKRSSYTENFTGSAYGTYSGAYETGSEQIGHDWESTPAPSGSLRSGVSASGVTFR